MKAAGRRADFAHLPGKPLGSQASRRSSPELRLAAREHATPKTARPGADEQGAVRRRRASPPTRSTAANIDKSLWADRYSRKLIIVRTAYIEGVLFTVAAFSPTVWVLAVARLLGGFVFGNTPSASRAPAFRSAPPSARSSAG